MNYGFKQPLGIRNNNPLNIRRGKTLWKGEIPSSPSGNREIVAIGELCDGGQRVGRGVRGVGSSFCKFSSVEWGLRAAFCLLRTYANKYRLCCVRDIISRWAPPTENDTTSYIRHVCLLTGFGGNQRLTAQDWPRMVKAMARMECGVDIDDETIAKAFLLYRETP
ncbi:MAG: hypothetical protein J5524_04490 [Bacteroidaceae bacterium]|nr:hypothetical protein [Bacteroidaceae bacterium]